MDWAEIASWPLSEHSQRIVGPHHRWHVQVMGEGPDLLLLHGAGGSTHSYRDLIPLLSTAYRVVALDLPGHGFTQLGARRRSGLAHMAQDIAALCQQQGWHPQAIVGHSAGAAVALRMAMNAEGPTPHVIGLNAALGEFPGVAGLLFPMMAKALAAMPFATTLFSSTSASPERVRALIASTGSELPPEGYALYRRLVADKAHVDGTLQMMAQWDLRSLLKDLPTHEGPVDLVAGRNDQTVPAKVSEETARILPDARVHVLDGLGHLAHEERPDECAACIQSLLQNKSAAQTGRRAQE